MRIGRWFVLAALVGVLSVTAAPAAGPVDIELAVAYWFAEEDVTGEASVDAEDVGGWVELGVSRWAFALSQWRVSPESDDADFTALDVKFRVFEPSEGNFIALGVGGERFSIQAEGFDDSVSYARVLVEGGVSIKVVRLVGRYAYIPDVGDLQVGTETAKGDTGFEAEALVSVHPFPFFYIHGGYKINSLDFDLMDGSAVTLESKGPYAGVGFKF